MPPPLFEPGADVKVGNARMRCYDAGEVRRSSSLPALWDVHLRNACETGGNARRAIDFHEGEKVDEAALKDLIRAAVALNLKSESKPKPRRESSKRSG